MPAARIGRRGAGAVFLAEPRDGTRRWLGVLGAGLPLAGAALLERVRFEFDAARRELRWQRRSLLRARSGVLAFADVEGVEVGVRRERSGDRPRSPAVPASASVHPAPAPASAALDPEIARLAASGEAIEAVKLARRRLGLELIEAKQLVERLRAGR